MLYSDKEKNEYENISLKDLIHIKNQIHIKNRGGNNED